jgi:hypothetical protein
LSEGLAELRVNGGSARRAWRGLGSNILRAKPAHELKKSEESARPADEPASKTAAAEISARAQMSVPFARFIVDYQALVETFRERSEAMEIARLELDRVAGLTTGYSGKLLSRKPRKHFGMTSLGRVLESLGLILIAVEDPAARDKTLACRERFDASNRRIGNQCNSKKGKSSHG